MDAALAFALALALARLARLSPSGTCALSGRGLSLKVGGQLVQTLPRDRDRRGCPPHAVRCQELDRTEAGTEVPQWQRLRGRDRHCYGRGLRAVAVDRACSSGALANNAVCRDHSTDSREALAPALLLRWIISTIVVAIGVSIATPVIAAMVAIT